MFRTIKTIVILSIISLISVSISCKSFDSTLLTDKQYIDNRIKPMDIIINKSSIDKCFDQQVLRQGTETVYVDFPDIIRQEIADVMKNHLMFSGKPGKYYLSVVLRKAEGKVNMMWFCLTIPTLGLIFPATTQTWSVELEAAVMTPDGKILKTYNAEGDDWERAGGIGGFDTGGSQNLGATDLSRTAYLKAVIEACDDLREQIVHDADYINNITGK